LLALSSHPWLGQACSRAAVFSGWSTQPCLLNARSGSSPVNSVPRQVPCPGGSGDKGDPGTSSSVIGKCSLHPQPRPIRTPFQQDLQSCVSQWGAMETSRGVREAHAVFPAGGEEPGFQRPFYNAPNCSSRGRT
jgi:hypothetical protein